MKATKTTPAATTATTPATASQSPTPTLDTLLAVHTACALDLLGGPRAWVLRGWASHIQGARAAQHAANSFAKHRAEFGDQVETARALTVARCVDFGLAPEDAAALVRERVAARLERED